MPDTIQVVRPFSGLELRLSPVGVMSVFNVSAQEWMPIGVVIELTQARRDVAGQDDDGTLNGEDYIETRLVSEWKQNRRMPDA